MCKSFYQNIAPNTMPLSDTSDKHCSQTVENLMHENKLLREELAKSKTTIKNLEATATNNLLSDKQVKQLDEEMEVVRQLYSIDLEHFAEPHEDGNVVLPGFFDSIADNINLQCPLLTKIIDCLAVGKSSKKNVGKKDCSFKFKAAIQAIMALDDIKSERSKSSFSTIFGLLLIAHGAGKALLSTLEPFGLCKSYNF